MDHGNQKPASFVKKLIRIHLPSFDFGEDKVNEKDLRDDGYKIGAFVVKNLGNEYKTSVENFIAKAQCPEINLNKILSAIHKTYTGLTSMFQGFQKCTA